MILGIALGFNYLHQRNLAPLILNPSNVLLDANLNPKRGGITYWYQRINYRML